MARLEVSDDYSDILSEMMAFHVEGRYPDSLSEPPTMKEAVEYYNRGREVFQWLMK